MAQGIYKLNFSNTDKVYIGKSISIEKRVSNHIYNMRKGTASNKLLGAFKLYGEPTFEIVIECDFDNLDTLEQEAISIWDAVDNGFNTIATNKYCADYISMYPITCNTAKNRIYNQQDIIDTLFTLINNPELTLREVSELLGVHITLVNSISACNNHIWLKDAFPKEYSMLLNMLGNRKHERVNKVYSNNILINGYTNEIVDINIFGVSNFCTANSLDTGAISKVLSKTRGSHKGWRLQK